MAIRLLIVDDHDILRKGLRAMFGPKPEFEIVGEANDGLEAVQATQALKPDVILMDLEMPRMNGIEAIRRIRQDNPAARILVLTSFVDDDRVVPAIRAGAMGYVLKASSPQELLDAIQTVSRGEPSLNQTVLRKLMENIRPEHVVEGDLMDKLTERELDVLRLIGKGYSNQQIALSLSLGANTVGGYVTTILNKLHMQNRTQLALYALREGLISLYDS